MTSSVLAEVTLSGRGWLLIIVLVGVGIFVAIAFVWQTSNPQKYGCVTCGHQMHKHRYDDAAQRKLDCEVAGCDCTYFIPRDPRVKPGSA